VPKLIDAAHVETTCDAVTIPLAVTNPVPA
jgi:hypothetical protein